MATTSVGDLARSQAFRRNNINLKQEMQRLSTEMSTGQSADTARKLSGDLSLITGIDASLERIKASKTNTAEAGLLASTLQTSLGTIATYASGLGQTLMTVSLSGTTSQIATAGVDGRIKFDAAIATLNTAIGGRSIFAGVATADAAVVNSETILTALDAAILGAVTAQDVATAVSNWFDDPAGFGATAYTGGASLQPFSLAPGETASLDVTAMDPAIRDSLKGFALASLLDRGTFAGQPASQKALAEAAGDALLQSQSARLNLSARLGLTEAQIANAETRNANENSSLQIARNDLVSVDAYETTIKLQETQSQLEMIYALTARMSRLSLMDYL